ncbi:polysaccharide biosynthesis/export family protein [Novosphingobium resinovorum]|uniref:polysaccharide biosynthesis/export family protein n=1 Tax=Novosphingobium resinovorum TaxID=158500 RepID=UPI002ED0991A|nr:polysaccharide biosynthesis/export family protein [Novosphingobium resinovorum]
MRLPGWLLGLAAVLFLLPSPSGAQEVIDQRRSYVVGTGDVLSVTVYRAPDYSSVVEVGEDGTIVLSLIGKVKVDGLTPPGIGDAVAARLREAGIFRDPVVNVLVQSYRSRTVSVLGAVGKPGEYPLERGQIRISEMLARSGAILGLGGGSIHLMRSDGSQRTIPAADVLSGGVDLVLAPQDTLIVNPAPSFYISGEVQKAGSYTVEPGLTIGRAIALAGGLTPRGSRSRVRITRQDGEEERTFKAKEGEDVAPKDLIVVGSRLF